MSEQISFDDFMRVDIRTGTVVEVRPFPEARKPAHIMIIDFGEELGLKEVIGANHRPLRCRRTCWPTSDGCGELSSTPDWALEV